MTEPMIPLTLVPPGINDQRDRDFVSALSETLSTFQPSALVIQDALTAPSDLLPIMVVEAGLSDFVSADMREDLLRAMISAAPEIHALSGLIAGTRRALAALNISIRWTQWWQEVPKAHHDTHKVVLFLNDTIIQGRAPLDLENQRAAARVIAATKRYSQDIAVQYGVRGDGVIYAGASSRRGRSVRINAPQLGNARFPLSSFFGTATRHLRVVRINARET
ncbi:phage tail protein I [Rhizobium sp. SL86]|uniref:phage tail protein I n=1 Tax=Rhizobium sp. SL86 TaxID=2995148 RepID=UPI0022747104|nr:phage tail protein I [Rhizobium sp. SL86]MCY1668070.1 phage tail protein I [Rhizobium sp. SL86]